MLAIVLPFRSFFFCHVLVAVAVVLFLRSLLFEQLDETYPNANPDAKTNVRSPVYSGENRCYSKDEHQSPKHHLCNGQSSQSSCSVHHGCDQTGDKSKIRSDAEIVKASKSVPWQPEGI